MRQKVLHFLPKGPVKPDGPLQSGNPILQFVAPGTTKRHNMGVYEHMFYPAPLRAAASRVLVRGPIFDEPDDTPAVRLT